MTNSIRMLLPPYVYKRFRCRRCCALKKLAMSVAFDGCIARALVPFLRSSCQVTFILDNIEIAAPDDGLLRVELC